MDHARRLNITFTEHEDSSQLLLYVLGVIQSNNLMHAEKEPKDPHLRTRCDQSNNLQNSAGATNSLVSFDGWKHAPRHCTAVGLSGRSNNLPEDRIIFLRFSKNRVRRVFLLQENRCHGARDRPENAPLLLGYA